MMCMFEEEFENVYERMSQYQKFSSQYYWTSMILNTI